MAGVSTPQMHSEAAGAKELVCDVCRVQFKVKRGWQRFCSASCRNAYHRTMTPESLRKDIDALRAANEELSRRVNELELAAARCGA